MTAKHAGPSSYRPKNQATAPPKGTRGPTAPAAEGKSLGHPHERKGKSAPSGTGFGKIKSTGKPRFERF